MYSCSQNMTNLIQMLTVILDLRGLDLLSIFCMCQLCLNYNLHFTFRILVLQMTPHFTSQSYLNAKRMAHPKCRNSTTVPPAG